MIFRPLPQPFSLIQGEGSGFAIIDFTQIFIRTIPPLQRGLGDFHESIFEIQAVIIYPKLDSTKLCESPIDDVVIINPTPLE